MDVGNRKLLIVDANRTVRRLIIDTLGKAGFKDFRESGDGTDALKALNAYRADLIISDIDMEPLSGVQMLSILRQGRARGANRYTPALILSGQSHPGAVIEAMEAGASSFLAKPFTMKTLIDRVQTCLRATPEFVEVPDAFGQDRSFIGPVTPWAEKTVLKGRTGIRRFRPG